MSKLNELVNYVANLTEEQIAKLTDYLPLLKSLVNTANDNAINTENLSVFKSNPHHVDNINAR